MLDPVAIYNALSPAERAEVDRLIAVDVAATPWRPLIDTVDPSRPTPQRMAYELLADITLYGGSAGGGKSDLLIGLAVTAHTSSIIFRREGSQHKANIDRIGAILRTRDGWNSQQHRWTFAPGRALDLGGVKDAGDEATYQGQPHDLIGFDEVTQFLESQFRFLIGWNRSTVPNQRCRVVAASNPPTAPEGEWVKRFWGPWLDDQHSNPAAPGELRWFIMTEDGDKEVDGPEPVTVNGEELIPRSRTFIPSSVDDNPFLRSTGYKSVLMGLPEPLRSQMLRGDFNAGGEDNPWAVIPTAWIKAAQERWNATPRPDRKLDALGVDPSRGGRDATVIAKRYGDWFGPLISEPGAEVLDGPSCAALVMNHLKDGAPAFVDVIGIGSSVYDHLHGNAVNVVAVNSSEASFKTDKTGKLNFVNKRAELWWKMREALEPDQLHAICLPPDPGLLADLAAPRWKLTARGIQVKSKQDIQKRLGRSTDKGDAVCYALQEAPKRGPMAGALHRAQRTNSNYNQFSGGHFRQNTRR